MTNTRDSKTGLTWLLAMLAVGAILGCNEDLTGGSRRRSPFSLPAQSEFNPDGYNRRR